MMNYTEVKFSFQPFDNIYPELLSASLVEIGFDTFHNEGEILLAYTPSGTISNEEIEDVINAFFIPDIKITFETSEIEEHNWNEEWEKMHYEPIIIINSRLSREQQQKAYRHELLHIQRGEMFDINYHEYEQ